MQKFFIKSNQIYDNKIVIIGEDVNHIKNVLRLKNGENINVCNIETKENFFCEIICINKESIETKVLNKMDIKTEPNVKINIFQGLPKADKMELIIQKSVELGAYEITPVAMERCIVKIDSKDENKKIERWQKISEVAAKQCGRDIIPIINNIQSINNICNDIKKYDIVLVAYENEKTNILKKELTKLKENNKYLKIGIVIGPEGGFEECEIGKLKQSGAKIITLGKRILRTETVALCVTSIIIYELDMI